jgi:HAD superfamily hydrolase (TIGR01490 family)
VDAAFFDLDKTVIARSSMMAFARPFRRAGLLDRRALAKGAATQFLYVRRGAGPKRLARIQRAALTVTAGWNQAEISRIVADHLADAIDPITYTDALRLIAAHRAAGRRVYLVSAAPEEIVEPIGRRLGVDETIASRACIDERGCFAGTLERYAYGAAKATLMAEAAQRHGIDLAGSWAYSDSVTDAPMLEVVGHPVAVNPDRALRDLARSNGWEVVRFEQVGESRRSSTRAGRLRSRRPAPIPASAPEESVGWRRHWGTLVSTVAAVVLVSTGGGLTAWRRYRRLHLRPA